MGEGAAWRVNCGDCCQQEDGRGGADLSPPVDMDGSSVPEDPRTSVLGAQPDRDRAQPISSNTERTWVAVTAYQPIDTVTRTVEIPVVKTVETYVAKPVIEERIVEVPKYIPEYVDRIVEVEEISYVDKIVEVPQIQWQYKYVPVIEYQENTIERVVTEVKYVERYIEVPHYIDVVKGKDGEWIEVGKSVGPPRQIEKPENWEAGVESITETKETKGTLRVETRTETVTESRGARVETSAMTQEAEGYGAPASEQEQIYVPRVVETVEVEKHVPVGVDVQVPYIVPKPVVVPVQVPVVKFRDNFHPVAVRRRVIPQIRWSEEVYEVECIREKPYLVVKDNYKPVACDVSIKVAEFVHKAHPINPTELSQADIHAMWMRCNADLSEKKRQEYGDAYPDVQHAPGTVLGEPGEGAPEGEEGGDAPDQMKLHPGHPLSMTYLQNKWLKSDTTRTHQQYSAEWFEAHQRALHGTQMQNPAQAQLSPQQEADIQQIGLQPWVQDNQQK